MYMYYIFSDLPDALDDAFYHLERVVTVNTVDN